MCRSPEPPRAPVVRAVLLSLALMVAVGCSAAEPAPPLRRPAGGPAAAASPQPAATSSASPAAPARAGSGHPPAAAHASAPPPAAAPPGRLVELPLDHGAPAVVSVPPAAARARPLLVATHGAGGRARTHCLLWQRIAGARAFILCPRGSSLDRRLPAGQAGYFYDGHPALGAEITRAIAALRARFGAAVDTARPVYAGYSQGATMGALMLPLHPAAFAAAVLMEGGFGQGREWNVASARRFHARGGRRVLLVCGRPICAEIGRVTAGYLRRGGLQVELVEAPGAGHHYDGAMHALVAARFGWVLGGDPRW